MRVKGKTIDIGRNVFHVTIKGGLTNDEIMKQMNKSYSAKYDNDLYGRLEFRFIPGDETYDWRITGYDHDEGKSEPASGREPEPIGEE